MLCRKIKHHIKKCVCVYVLEGGWVEGMGGGGGGGGLRQAELTALPLPVSTSLTLGAMPAW